jgi:alpha-beta hydrolase superfamily lysophospholipase
MFSKLSRELASEISDLLSQNNSYKKITLMGHSYGGILVAHVLKHWNTDTPIEVHIIASPLLGTTMLRNICGYEPIETVPNNSSLFEWRTQHQLDSAFKDLIRRPSADKYQGSLVTVLPETYKGNRLGHNWSISWVADEIF